MKIFITAFATLMLLAGVLTASSFAQNLFYGPESVAFDSLYDRYLVSNYHNGSIVQVDTNGTQSYFITDLGRCFGNTIAGNALYVSVTNSTVLGVDLATAEIVSVFGFSTLGHLDGMTADSSGFLYVVDTGGRIIKTDLATGGYSIFVSSGLTPGLQDIIFDPENNRLLAVSYYQNAPIQAIDLSDSSVYNIVFTSFGNFDGITRDQFGNTYVATYSNSGCIYRYDPEFALGPELISSGHQGPAGIDYNRQDNILAVPNFYGNTVDFIPIEVTSANNIINPCSIDLIGNYPNPFNAYTTIEFGLNESGNVRLEIFDNLGRRIETLIDSVCPPGIHNVTWNAGSISTGIYFYRIQTDESIRTHKMILLK